MKRGTIPPHKNQPFMVSTKKSAKDLTHFLFCLFLVFPLHLFCNHHHDRPSPVGQTKKMQYNKGQPVYGEDPQE